MKPTVQSYSLGDFQPSNEELEKELSKLKEEKLKEFEDYMFASYRHLRDDPYFNCEDDIKYFLSKAIDESFKAGEESMKNKILEWAKKNTKEIDDAGYEMGGTSIIIYPEELKQFLNK